MACRVVAGIVLSACMGALSCQPPEVSGPDPGSPPPAEDPETAAPVPSEALPRAYRSARKPLLRPGPGARLARPPQEPEEEEASLEAAARGPTSEGQVTGSLAVGTPPAPELRPESLGGGDDRGNDVSSEKGETTHSKSASEPMAAGSVSAADASALVAGSDRGSRGEDRAPASAPGEARPGERRAIAKGFPDKMSGLPSSVGSGPREAENGHLEGRSAARVAPSPLAPSTSILGVPRQLVFEGRRSGEGYFSRDGRRLVFQSEREESNPFYQIYTLDLESGVVERVSNGIGKTTCAWFHPREPKILFASTHEDPAAQDKMKAELELRASGKTRRYAWDYDETYDIYETRLKSGTYRRLTSARGYDAEASWSPDGDWIVFASNRRAYQTVGGAPVMTEREAALFEIDPASMIDIYRMRADGLRAERLTDHVGYDGGPFFSPDGRRITFRRFTPDGKTAEIWTMAADGTDQRPLTRLGAMSWAPFYHPSGDYLIFTTNLHGYSNFELYLVDVEGRSPPVRVTDADGFDGLPVFSPDGRSVVWTNSRTASGKAQLFIADWNDAAARAALGLPARPPSPSPTPRRAPVLSELRIKGHVEALTAPEMGGRLTGTEGERQATDYVRKVFETIGLEPLGEDGWYQTFELVSGVGLDGRNRLEVTPATGGGGSPRTGERLGESWRPLAFSRLGPAAAAPLAFAGYGIVAPSTEGQPAYDAYGDLDVRDRWVVVFRFQPEATSPERRPHLARYASLRFKAMEARDRGAAGLIVVSGPTSKVKEELVPLRFDAAITGAGIPAVSVSDALATRLLGRPLEPLQSALDEGEPAPGFLVDGVEVAAEIGLVFERATGRNVIGRLRLAPRASPLPPVVIGAHVDHLGRGEAGDSLARSDEMGLIHPGADDNASGVAALLELSRWMSQKASAGELDEAHRDVVFAAWSGEEIGLLGASRYVDGLDGEDGDRLPEAVGVYLNMDMIGRLDPTLVVQGVGSSPVWRALIERENIRVGLPIRLSDDTYLPTDATPFYLGGVPILSAFTGAHPEYHTPRDTLDRVSVEGIAQVAELMGRIGLSIVHRPDPVPYVRVAPPKTSGRTRTGRAYLGTIPDYAGSASDKILGVPLSGVSASSPAEKAGLRGGDVLVELAGQKIETIYDFVRTLDALKVGQPTAIVVLRGGERVILEVTPESRE